MAERSKKNPLESKWTLWYDDPELKKRRDQDWGASLKQVYAFDTVEDFWCLFNNIIQPSQMPLGSDMHLFRSGIAPKWEDTFFKKNGEEQHGGKWTVIVRDKKLLDEYWLNCLLALIGEQFNEPDEIAGVVVSVRGKQAKMCLWTRSEQNQAVQTSIAMQFKKIMDMNETDKITYQFFIDETTGERRDLYIV